MKKLMCLADLEPGMQFEITRGEGMKPETFILTRRPDVEEKIFGDFIWNERMNKWWAIPLDGGQPELMCFDRYFSPDKYNFRYP